MARQLIAALRHAGHAVDVASDLRSFEGKGQPKRQRTIRIAAETEAGKIIEGYQSGIKAERPDVWFTYHLYYKAPDWIGPAVSSALGLGYVVAEASHAPKRADGPWALGHDIVAKALYAADSVLALTKRDMPCVEPLLNGHAKHFYLPPFLDLTTHGGSELRNGVRENTRIRFAQRHKLDAHKLWLLAVAMMRPGDKLESYRLLARGLASLRGDDWQMIIVGDGEARADVESAFSSFGAASEGGRVAVTGEVSESALHDVYAACDVFVWPAINEAYGMALLEAQAAGLPVVAGNEGGVPDVVCDNVTGVLVDPGNPEVFATAVRTMLDNAAKRRKFGTNARRFVRDERSLALASNIVNEAVLHAHAAHDKDSRRAS